MALLKNALIAFGIALAAAIPPGLHLVTFWIGPAIGGFFAGLRLRCKFEQAAAVGALVTALLVITGGVIMAVASELSPSFLRNANPNLVIWLAMAIALYVLLLTTVGAWIGGAMARRSEPTTTPPIHD